MNDSEEKLLNLLGVPVEKGMIEIFGYNINYIKAGAGDPMLLIHGLNFGWGQWYKNIPAFSKKYTVYALDLPGSGSSSDIDLDKENIVDLFPKIVYQFIVLKKLYNPVLVGHSIGSWISLRLAIEYKSFISKIVLVNPLGLSKYLVWKQRLLAFKPFVKFFSKTVMSVTAGNMGNFLRGVFYNPQKLPEVLINYYYQAVSRSSLRHPFSLINKLIKPFHIREEFIIGLRLLELDVPVAIFVSTHDPLLPLRSMKKSFNFFTRCSVFEDSYSGHVIPVENSEYFNKNLLNFLLV